MYMYIQMENTADEWTSFYEYPWLWKKAAHADQMWRDCRASSSLREASELYMEELFLQMEEAGFDQHETLWGPSAGNNLFRLPRWVPKAWIPSKPLKPLLK